jgi:hypothetical protein
MRLMGRLGLVALACLVTAGCITSETLVKVKADGSGTIEQTISMKKEGADQLKELMAGFGAGQAGKAVPAELFSEKDMREAATKLGEGVTFVSSKPIAGADRTGRVALYTFADITKVHVDQRPAAPGGSASGMKQSGSPEEIRFAFVKLPNGHRQLSILFPEPKPGEKKTSGDAPKKGSSAAKSEPPDPAQVEMMKKVFDGLRIDVALEVAGPIVKTNSAYVEGSRVTLLQMDFAQLLQDQEQLSKMTEPKSLEEAKAALRNIKGFKVNLDKEITVEFAPK